MTETFSRHGLDLRGRDSGAAPSEKLDPLAELARLVGRDDPFRELFPNRDKSGQAPSVRPPQLEARAPIAERFDRYQSEHLPNPADAAGSLLGTPEHADLPSHEAEEQTFHAPLGQGRRDSFRLPALPGRVHTYDADADSEPFLSDHAEAPELNADLWAQGMPEPVSAEPLHFGADDDHEDAQGQGSQRRTLVVLLAVLALTVGGLGATFLVRGGSAGQMAAGDVPTITADGAPTKVQPPDTSNQSTGGDGNTALIEKSASDNVANAKVVSTQEQPVDLSQLPQAPAATAPAADSQAAAQPNDGRVATATFPAGSNPSPFPEPHRVKTILIRPDGSVVGDEAPGAPLALQAAPPQPAASTPVARPSTPKSTARASSTPKTTAAPTEGVAAVKPKAAHAAPKPQPVQTAAADTPTDATASTATAAAVGAFAVQLAAPATEQEAKDVSARLQKKFSSELDGHAPSIHKAEKGDKSVYRVRVSNLSQDDAKGLCAKLQASGGSCFVVRN